MKILHLTEQFAPVGGSEQYLLNLLPLLADAGHQNVVVYWQEHPQTARPDNTTVHHAAGVTAQERRQRTEAIIGQERPAVIYTHTARDAALVEAVARLRPTIAYVHDFHLICPGLAKFYRRGAAVCNRPYGLGCAAMIYLRRCATARHPVSVYRIMQTTRQHLAAHQQVARLLVASNYMRELLAQNGLDAGRITVLPHFAQLPPVPHPVDTPAGGPNLLFAGRLEDEKGLPYLLRALARINHPYRLLVAGDGNRRAAYQSLAHQLGIAGRVDFLGWLNQAQLEQVYRQISCLILPSIWPEPFGMVGIDAFSHSRPVIAFNVGGIPDWLQDGRNGYLVPTQDVGQLAGRIENLLAEPELAARMGANGRRDAEQRYTAERHLATLLPVFDKVLESAG